MLNFLTPYLLYIKLAVFAGLVAGAFAAGWKVKGWDDSAQVAAQERNTAAVVEAFHSQETKVSEILEAKLTALSANQTIVEKTRETIIQRPVFRNVCLDADSLRLINAARLGTAPPNRPAPAVPSSAQ